MELIRTPEDLVTRVALVRAMRGLSHATLAKRLGVEAADVLQWERGRPVKPAMAKRMSLAMRWRWEDFLLPPMAHDDAWSSLVEFRQHVAR